MNTRAARWFVVLLLALVPLGASAQTETIDFEGIQRGSIVDSVSGDGGTGPVFVKGTNPECVPYSPWNAAVIFDSANPIQADLDLGTPNETFGGPGVGVGGQMGSAFENDTAQGNILIVNECRFFVDRNLDGQIDSADSPVDRTNDADLVGSSLEFDFSAVGPVTVESIVIIDVEADEPSALVEFFNGSGGLISSVSMPQVGDNGKAEIDLGMVSNVDSMRVTINGSGAIDNLVFGPPAPFCGDGNIDPGETCDPPGQPMGEPDECRDNCTFCGDGVLNGDEECDDGNNDPNDGCDPYCVVEAPFCGDGEVNAPGETCDPPGQPLDQPDECRDDCTFCGDGILDTGEECDDGNNAPGDGCDPYCLVEVGGEGCTPGYWKQDQHFCNWTYSTGDLFDDVFGVDAPGNDTLLQALSDGGGGETAFQRHAVAALLNAADDGVDYAFSVDQVKAIVVEAYETGNFEMLKNILEAENESGCPLGNCNERTRLEDTDRRS